MRCCRANKFNKTAGALPSLDQQRKISDEIIGLCSRCFAVEEVCASKLQDLDDLSQFLLQKAFAGELTWTAT